MILGLWVTVDMTSSFKVIISISILSSHFRILKTFKALSGHFWSFYIQDVRVPSSKLFPNSYKLCSGIAFEPFLHLLMFIYDFLYHGIQYCILYFKY